VVFGFSGKTPVAFVSWYSLRHTTGRLKLMLFTVVMACGWVIFVWCSLSLYPYGNIVPVSYAICQFGYRMVNMVNLVIFALLLGTGFWLKNRNLTPDFPQSIKMTVAVLLTASSFVFMEKMIHVASMLRPSAQDVLVSRNYMRTLTSVPGSFYGLPFFTSEEYRTDPSPRHAPTTNRNIEFYVESDPFGTVTSRTVQTDKGGWYTTNVYAFVWNKIRIDGKETVPQVFPFDSMYFNVYLPPGEHTLEYVYDAPPLWRFLRYVSLATFVTLLVCLDIVLLRSARENAGKQDSRFL